MKTAWTKKQAWAIGTVKANGFHPRRIVWGRALARAERRDGERIERVLLLTDADIEAIESARKAALLKDMRLYMRDSAVAQHIVRPEGVTIEKFDIKDEAGGKTINIPLVTRIKSKSASAVLDGTEELAGYNCAVNVDWMRR